MDTGFLIFLFEKYRQKYRHFSKCPDQPRARLLILRISASSALSALVSQASVRPLSGGGDSRTGTHQNEQSVGTADCVAITLRTFANRCHVRRWKPLVTSLETRLSPKASVSAAICCAVLHSEPTISEIRAVFVACAERWFPCVPTASVSRELLPVRACCIFLRLRYGQSVHDATSCPAGTGVDARIELWHALVLRPPSA